MVKITDTIEIHDGVALMIGRHDSAAGPNIDAIGGMYAYAMGKFAPEYFRIDPPEHIIHSPISRARNTAKMHAIAQGVTTEHFPQISYDERLHEQSKPTDKAEAAREAIKEAQAYGYKTIELITHSNDPLGIAEALGGSGSGSLSYGGMVVLYADSWEDMLDPNVFKRTEVITSSKDLVANVLGPVQAAIIDCMANIQNRDINATLGSYPEIRAIWKEAGVDFTEPEKQLNAIIKAKKEETAEWAIKALKGEEVDSVVRPDEFLEIYDAYKYWAENMALSVSIAAPAHRPEDPLHSELMTKLLSPSARTLVERLSEEDADELHPIYHARMGKLEKGKLTARKAAIKGKSGSFGLAVPGYTDIMEPEKFSPDHKESTPSTTSHDEGDHPLLYALLAAKLRRGEGKK